MHQPDIDPRIIRLYDEYTHAPLPRRVFLERLARLCGGMAAAMAVVPLLENNYALAQVVAADDARLITQTISYPGASGPVGAYEARPRDASGQLPAVIVIHENRGLNPHILDVTRRVALAGFRAVAPDLLSPLGGTPADQDKAREMIGKLDARQTIDNLVALVSTLENDPRSNGKVGVVGFCWGGGMANQLAVHAPRLTSAVVYYGLSPTPEEAARIKAPLLLHYAERDERINKGVPAYEQALKASGASYTLYLYPGVDHAFNNDTAGPRYNEAAATLAWQRTIDFLKLTLTG